MRTEKYTETRTYKVTFKQLRDLLQLEHDWSITEVDEDCAIGAVRVTLSRDVDTIVQES